MKQLDDDEIRQEVVRPLDPSTGYATPLDIKRAPLNTPMPMAWADEDGMLHPGVYMLKSAPQPHEYWWKLMLSDMLNILDDISGKQTDALKTVLDQFDPRTGLIVMSQQELAAKAKCSYATMNRVLQIMIRHNVIAMKARGVYVINPAFMSQGGSTGRFDTLMIQYAQAKGEDRPELNAGNEKEA